MARVYAVPSDLGPTPPADAEQLLADASEFLDAEVFRLCWFDADEDGYPANTLVREAFRRATCAQVRWWGKVGDPDGGDGAGWGAVEIGSVRLSRSVTAVDGADSPARQVAPRVFDALRSPDLTRDIFVLGMVST